VKARLRIRLRRYGVLRAAFAGALPATKIRCSGPQLRTSNLSFAIVVIRGRALQREAAAVGADPASGLRGAPHRVNLTAAAELFMIYLIMARGADVPPRQAAYSARRQGG